MKNKAVKKNILWMIGIGIVVFTIVTSIILQNVLNSEKPSNTGDSTGTNEDASDDWKAAFESNERQLIYLGRPSCSWCNKLRPELNNMGDKYGVEFVYINTDKTSQDDMNTIFSKLGIDGQKFGTPYLVIIENGKKVAEQVGYVEEETLFKFLQDNDIIDSSEKYE
jgi:predicted bacteriocin transport accessory protein